MNVGSSTSATSASSASSTTATAATSTAVKSQEKTSTSFDEEMKNVDADSKEQNVQQNTDSKTQNKEENSADDNLQKNDKTSENNTLSGKVEVNSDIDVKLNTADLLSLNIQQLLDTQNQLSTKSGVLQISISTSEDLTKSIGETLNYQSMEMSLNDAQFFVDVVNNNNAGVQNVVKDIQQAMTFGTEEVQKSANVSKTLINALQNSVKTGQAVRIDFGNDVAVVMRVGRDGAIMANFIPGDKAVEEYLKNNIDLLKQRFEEEDIPYSQLSYSQHQQQERRQKNENDKENRHE